MNHNRKRREAEARQRQRQRAESDLTHKIQVNPTALAPCNSYGWPDFIDRGYYLDVPFTCASCGAEEVWTASQQKWWYEEMKGSLYSWAKFCRPCREETRLTKGTAHPLKDYRRWLGQIRPEIEPALLAAGWRLVIGGESRPSLLSYSRGEVLFRFRWGSGSDLFRTALILELRDSMDASFRTLVSVECDTYNMTQSVLQRRFDCFVSMAKDELKAKASL